MWHNLVADSDEGTFKRDLVFVTWIKNSHTFYTGVCLLLQITTTALDVCAFRDMSVPAKAFTSKSMITLLVEFFVSHAKTKTFPLGWMHHLSIQLKTYRNIEIYRYKYISYRPFK